MRGVRGEQRADLLEIPVVLKESVHGNRNEVDFLQFVLVEIVSFRTSPPSAGYLYSLSSLSTGFRTHGSNICG